MLLTFLKLFWYTLANDGDKGIVELEKAEAYFRAKTKDRKSKQ